MEKYKNKSNQWRVWIFCDHYNENDVLKRVEKYGVVLWSYIVAEEVRPGGDKDYFVLFIQFDRPITRNKLCRLMVNDSLGSVQRLYSGQSETPLIIMEVVQDANSMEEYVRSKPHCVLIV